MAFDDELDYEPILSDDEYDKLQDRLADSRRLSDRIG